MLDRQRRTIARWSFAIDGLMAVVLLSSTYYWLLYFLKEWQWFLTKTTGYPFHIQEVSHLSHQGWLFLVILSSFGASFGANRFYQISLSAKSWDVAFNTLKCVLIGVGLTVLFFYFFSIVNVNRSLVFLFALSFWCWVTIKEIMLRAWLRRKYYASHPLQVLLVATSDRVSSIIESCNAPGQRSLHTRNVLLNGGEGGELAAEYRHLVRGTVKDISRVLAEDRYDLVYFCEEGSNPEEAAQVLAAAEEQGVEVWCQTPYLNATIFRPELDEFGDKTIVVFRQSERYPFQRLFKRLMDFGVSLILLIGLSPLLLLIALAIKLTSKGPIFFCQERTGYRRHDFHMIKFRTMVVDAAERQQELTNLNEMSGPVFKIKDDPRITRVGRFLRRFSLDELPQLINVLRGEMSLVGPRPLPTYETKQFAAFRDYRRYMVLPGLTGLWQVSGRTHITDFNEWVRLDLEYIDNWSIWLDFLILLKTIPAVFRGEGE